MAITDLANCCTAQGNKHSSHGGKHAKGGAALAVVEEDEEDDPNFVPFMNPSPTGLKGKPRCVSERHLGRHEPRASLRLYSCLSALRMCSCYKDIARNLTPRAEDLLC